LIRHVLTWHAKGTRSLQCLTVNSAMLFSLEISIWMQFPVEFKILGWSFAHAMFSTNLLVGHEINSLPLFCTSEVQYFKVYFQFQPGHTGQITESPYGMRVLAQPTSSQVMKKCRFIYFISRKSLLGLVLRLAVLN
jgi:hypothetical protein